MWYFLISRPSGRAFLIIYSEFMSIIEDAMSKKTATIAVHTQDEFKDKFSALAIIREISVSELALIALQRYVEQEESRYRLLHGVFGNQEN